MHLYSERNDKPLMMIGENRFPKRRPIGSYEKLLCKDCEQKLGVYDNYAQDLLLKKSLDFFPNTDLAYIIPHFDYFVLKSFFISLLWRASITKLEEFKLIDAGPYEFRLRDLIISDSVGGKDEFSIFITKFDSKNEKNKYISEKSILFPAKQRIDNALNYSVFYLSSGYKVYIKVDKRNTDELFIKLILKDAMPMVILRMDNFEDSPEYRILLNIAKNNRELGHFFKSGQPVGNSP